MSQLDEIQAEVETLRVFILRYRDTGGPVLCDGKPATLQQIADLKFAIARYEFLLLKLGDDNGASDT